MATLIDLRLEQACATGYQPTEDVCRRKANFPGRAVLPILPLKEVPTVLRRTSG